MHKEYIIQLAKTLGKKYTQQYTGKFTVLKRIGRLAYQLDLPSSWEIHPVISVAYLEPAPKEDDPFNRQSHEPGPVITSNSYDPNDSAPSYEIEQLLDTKVTNVRGKTKIEYLVRWLGYGPEWDVWYNIEDLQQASDLITDYKRIFNNVSEESLPAAEPPKHRGRSAKSRGRPREF